MSMISRSRRSSGTIPTSSMADIAFLLLVFFLVTTVFPKDRGLALVLPDDGVTTPVDRANLLVLTVTGDGAVEVLPGSADQSFRIDVARLGSVWRERVAARPGLIAAIRTRPDAPYGAMIDVLDALQGAGARRISLQVDGR